MRRASNLTREELERVVSQVVDFAYLVDDGGNIYYDRDREINGGDFVQSVCEVLTKHQLAPDRGHDDPGFRVRRRPLREGEIP